MLINKYSYFQVMTKFQKKYPLMLGIFLANTVYKALQKVHLLSIEENSLLVNHITQFENR